MNQSLADPNFSCINNDGLAQYAIYDPQLSLLCQECQARERRQNCKTLTLEEAIQKVEDKLSLVETKIDQQVQKLSQLINSAKDFRSQFLTVFDLIIINLESWNESLQHMNKNSYILQELQYLETKQTTLFEKLFTSNNYIYITKLCNRFKEYNFVYQNDQQKFSRLLTQMMKETQIPKLDSQIELIKRQQVPQNDACLNLAFNSSDSIMVSTKGINIQAWSFDKGKINLLQNLGGHEDWVNCIVYSKSKEAFFRIR